MKNELNKAIAGIVNAGEEDLFKEMANQFNNNKFAKCTYVKEIHQMYVAFNSNLLGNVIKRELGDLLLLTFDKAKKEIRLCVLQAKYRKGAYRKFLSYSTDVYQWELLYYKLDVYNKSSMSIPKHILNFRYDYKSITAYGFFYRDKAMNMIDFLYTLPEYFKPRNMMSSKSTFDFTCPNLGVCKSSCCGCNTTICPTKQSRVPKETLFTCSMDIFEREVLHCKVGAPINNDDIRKYILGLLSKMKKDADEPEVIDEILRIYEYDYDVGLSDYKYDEGHPAAIIVVTDSKEELTPYII